MITKETYLEAVKSRIAAEKVISGYLDQNKSAHEEKKKVFPFRI